jgi:hypothetical protein
MLYIIMNSDRNLKINSIIKKKFRKFSGWSPRNETHPKIGNCQNRKQLGHGMASLELRRYNRSNILLKIHDFSVL